MIQKIEDKKQYLLHWMYDFIEDDDEPAYLKSDVAEFDKIISLFIKEVGESSQRSDYSWVCAKIEALVLNLNELNRKHVHQLIEAHQREDICALISLVVQHAGHDYQDDITEQWREW
ncbi:hypothetical protein [Rheinheimera salexigens]|uniref:Uncharacterized protein n=1 Tax=Rheinheimera salexigens TaxID=1628148 RepID=A0A1E7Q364_9GAMM|nr:hypothetical protein [Rheinheimera salexigens]OEY68508.1 hypothetical protein BI198_02185 [Rheinheimera salexigens]